jgi:hypothetical protein
MPTVLSYIDHICRITCPMFVTPSSPGDGAATPGDTAGQGAAPPGDQVILADARGWPLPPPCPGYRTVYRTRGVYSKIIHSSFRHALQLELQHPTSLPQEPPRFLTDQVAFPQRHQRRVGATEYL